MLDTRTRSSFERMITSGAGDAGALAGGLRRDVTQLGLRALAAKLLHVAVCAPGRMVEVYDNAANGWLSGPVFAPNFRGAAPLSPSDAFWRAFWAMIETPTHARRRTSFTVDTMRLSSHLGPRLTEAVAAAASEIQGIAAAAADGAGSPPPYEILAAYPASSLGGALYLEMTARGETREMFEPDALGLSKLPPPLDYVNLRVLQCRLLWALVGGYSAAQLDEIAFAAFQMGQFGHHFSSLMVGLTVTTVAIDRPPGLELVLDSVFQGWLHGRETPLLLGVEWEDLLPLPVEAVRRRLGVRKFASPLAAAARRARAAKDAGDGT